MAYSDYQLTLCLFNKSFIIDFNLAFSSTDEATFLANSFAFGCMINVYTTSIAVNAAMCIDSCNILVFSIMQRLIIVVS